MTDLLGGASYGFSNHQSISEALSDAQLRIVALGRAESYRAAPDSSLATLLEGIRKSYTMEGERRIHDAMWGKPAPKVVAVPTGGDADDLFEDFGAIAPEPAPEAEIEGLDMFDDFGSSEPEVVVEAPKAVEPLGTVEDDVLFF